MSKTRIRIDFKIGLAIGLAIGILLLLLPFKAKALEIKSSKENAPLVIGSSETIDDNLLLAAPRVKMAGKVSGDLVVVAQEADISGEVQGNLLVLADRASLNGSVARDVYIVSREILLARDLKIEKDLYGAILSNFTDSGAKINGKSKLTFLKTKQPPSLNNVITGEIISFLSVLFLGWFLLWLLPKFSREVGENFSRHLGKSLLVGMASLLVLPLAILVSLITVVGLPISMLLAVFLWFAIYSAWLWAGLALGKYLTGDKFSASTKLFLGLLLLKMIALAPGLGQVLVFVVVLVGVGSLVLTFYGARKTLK